MAQFEDLKRGVKVKGIQPNSIVTLVDVENYGSDAVSVIYRDEIGNIANRVLYRWDEPSLEIVRPKSLWRGSNAIL